MPGRGHPVLDHLLELVGGHAGVRGHHDFYHGAFASGQRRLDVALQHRRERLLRFPLGVLRRQRLHAVEREDELEVHRLLGPQRAVVVEGGDALARRHVILAAGFDDRCHEGDDARLGMARVPRWQRVGLRESGRGQCHGPEHRQCPKADALTAENRVGHDGLSFSEKSLRSGWADPAE